MTTLIIIVVLSIVPVWLAVLGIMSVNAENKRVKAGAVNPRQYLRDARRRDMLEWDKEFRRLSGIREPHVGYPWAAPTTAELTRGEWVIKIKEYVAEDKKHG